MTIAKDTSLFFRKLPKTEKTPPNATYIRFVGTTPADECHEIFYCGERWKVSRNQFHLPADAMKVTAQVFRDEIEGVKTNSPGLSRFDLAGRLGISEGTLVKRLKFIHNHL